MDRLALANSQNSRPKALCASLLSTGWGCSVLKPRELKARAALLCLLTLAWFGRKPNKLAVADLAGSKVTKNSLSWVGGPHGLVSGSGRGAGSRRKVPPLKEGSLSKVICSESEH